MRRCANSVKTLSKIFFATHKFLFTDDPNLASIVQVCSRNNKNLADCIIRSVRILQPSLASGNLGNGFQIPPLEPFAIDK